MFKIIIISKKRFEELSAKLSAVLDGQTQTKANQKATPSILKDYIDNHELMLRLGVSKRTLSRYRGKGDLPYTIIGGKVYYSKKDIEGFLKKYYYNKGKDIII